MTEHSFETAMSTERGILDQNRFEKWASLGM